MERTKALTAVGELAAEQWGLVTTAQAQAAGVSRVNLTRLVDADLLRHAGRGVYQMAGTAPTAHEEIKVAWLRLDPGTPAWQRALGDARSGVVSHASACRLHHLGDIPADSVEISVPRRRTTRDREVVLYVLGVGTEDITVVDGLPVTTVDRTIVDLLKARADAGHVGRVLADADQRGLVDTGELAARVAPYARAYGLGRSADGEELLRVLADQAGFVLRADTLTPAGERAVAATAVLLRGDAVARAVGQQQAVANAINAMAVERLQPLHDVVNAAGVNSLGAVFNAANASGIDSFGPLYNALSAIGASNNDVLNHVTLTPALDSLSKDLAKFDIPAGFTDVLDSVHKILASNVDIANMAGIAGAAARAAQIAGVDVDIANMAGIAGAAARAAQIAGVDTASGERARQKPRGADRTRTERKTRKAQKVLNGRGAKNRPRSAEPDT
ncbi:type IV toxin-antitoxin system AbiEi family antitoxin domain-containing protein [Streptodolium elevatio]|uniref:Type IV toxin-antitoxin system AbiEi family antitoxin domain-containing protein n=1 Tax=Streptodolium elevatio TaxID=3157996 RepID=A0ABV3DM33_9ACTN